mmetsp:Transcript_4035/g.6887  ORF Transcript_4035/g.6887 Transcript_4035/m.6887 type:complete len:340 (-) Transcript_4035:397-1416(-)
MDATRFKKALLPGLKASGSPSLKYNNLSAGGGRLCFTDSRQVHLIPAESLHADEVRISQAGLKDSNVIYQSKFVKIREKWYLVLATDAGVQIWDALGNNILFNFVFPTGLKDPQRKRSNFARGITVVLTAEDVEVICVGSSSGDIFLFEGSGIKFRLVNTLKGRDQATSDLTSDYACRCSTKSDASRRLISADDGGRVVVYDAISPSMFEKSFFFEASSDQGPCVSVVVRDDRLVCALSTGQLCFYNLATQTKWLELKAHTRFASSMTLHPTRDRFVSVAEDSTLQVLTLPQVGEKIEVVMSTVMADSMITGAAWFGNNHDDLAVCAYDTDYLHVWKMN